MLQVTLVLCCICLCSGFLTERKAINPLTLMFGEWLIILFLASLRLYNILPASKDIYHIIFLGLIFYVVGYYCFRIIKIKFKFNHFSTKKLLLDFLSFVSIVIFFLDALNSLQILLTGGDLKTIREVAQEGNIYNNSILNLLRILVAAPFANVLSIIAPVNFFLSKTKNFKLYFYTILIICLKIISDGSRSIFILFSISCLICLVHTNKIDFNKIKFVLKKKTWICIVSLVVFLFIIFYLTLSRSGAQSLRYTYYYFSMEPIMFEKWKNIVDATNFIGYGTASFNGFLFIIFNILSTLFGVVPSTLWSNSYDFIERVGTDWQIITSNGLTANSYVTVFFPLYLDGREFGVCLGMFIFGAFSAILYNQVYTQLNERNISIYILVMMSILLSFQLFIFENIYYSLSFIMLLLIFKKRRFV